MVECYGRMTLLPVLLLCIVNCCVVAVGVAMIPGLRKRGIIQQVMKQAGDTVSGLRGGKDKST